MQIVSTNTTVSSRFTARVSSILLVILFLTGLANISFKSAFEKPLYLYEKAVVHVGEKAMPSFERKVRKIGKRLDVDPDWLMATMYNESRFDVSVKNYQGSGATGLIQIMPATAGDYNITTEELKDMTHVDQLDYVYKYLKDVKRRYRPFTEPSDLYLAILYPKALGAEDHFEHMREKNPQEEKWKKHHDNFVLYASPSRRYKQNVGLDENKDGKVTVIDIRAHMKRRYPELYDNSPSEAEILAIADSAKIWAEEDFLDELETKGEILGLKYLEHYADQINTLVKRHKQMQIDGIASAE